VPLVTGEAASRCRMKTVGLRSRCNFPHSLLQNFLAYHLPAYLSVLLGIMETDGRVGSGAEDLASY
jgi:hypothetical protein